ncbi:hypothetical protein KFZ67_04170 [Photobacterium damselae]|uniref:hypothetical protein n=1 Tax=Photobacterium damselae TaxID=38293 RepID=UPI00254359BA
MKKVIACTGYGGTGSSVISDLLKEFGNVKSFGEFEFRFLQDPGGIRELEFGILQNNDRLLTSYYISKYIKNINYLSKSKVYNYEKFFNKKFKTISDKYINNLVSIKWNGFWHQDIIDANIFCKFFYYSERFFQKNIIKIGEGGSYLYNNIFKNKMYYVAANCDFYKLTKNYLTELIMNSDHDNKEFVVFDQLVPASNAESYINYFDNIKIIIIDRDPRDLYLLNKLFWKEKWIPSDDIDMFIEWYLGLRINEVKSPHILRLKFEDFIYNYESTVLKVCNFTGIDIYHHESKYKYFDPNISIKNTNLKEKYNKYIDEVLEIEDKLSKYCYCFERELEIL